MTEAAPEESSHFLEFVENEHGEWFWRHKARNGEQLARSSETYRTEDTAVKSARTTLGINRVALMRSKTIRHTPDTT